MANMNFHTTLSDENMKMAFQAFDIVNNKI